MISEIISLPIDIAGITTEMMKLIRPYPPASRGGIVDGWALQSTNGSYKDGWDWEFCPFNGPQNKGPEFTPYKDQHYGLRPVQNYFHPTEINSPVVQSLFQTLDDAGLNPRKARVIRLRAQTECGWHQDGVKDYCQVRLHIPLVTNPACFFERPDGRIHMEHGTWNMEHGKIYLVHVNNQHRIVNHGDSDRYNFVCHVWDQKKISKSHQYDALSNVGKSYLPESLR